MAENPPAFATSFSDKGDTFVVPGMTLLDYFAGQSLAGLEANIDVDCNPKTRAEFAYRMAHAMLEERKKVMRELGQEK